jgi:hypothetical protein
MSGLKNNKNRFKKIKSMKTAIMSIPTCAASIVLIALNDHRIKCEYVGIDQAERILMRLRYEEAQEKRIEELTLYMNQSEKLLLEIKDTIKAVIQKANDKVTRQNPSESIDKEISNNIS